MKWTRKIIVIMIFLSLIGAFVFLSRKQYAHKIHAIQSFTQASNILQTLSSKSIVLFDVDDTLITAHDQLARGFHRLPWWLFWRIFIAHPSLLKAKNFEDMHSIVWQQSQRFLIEPIIGSIIDSLKERGVTVLALTSMESGNYGVIASMPEWRYQMLAGMGITFSKQYPDTIFDRLLPYRDNHPILYKGILCANQQPKGEVLGAFLDAYRLAPDRIVSFDDDMRSLQSIGDTCQRRSILCTLFLCQKWKELPYCVDASRVLEQVKILIEQRRWIDGAKIDVP